MSRKTCWDRFSSPRGTCQARKPQRSSCLEEFRHNTPLILQLLSPLTSFVSFRYLHLLRPISCCLIFFKEHRPHQQIMAPFIEFMSCSHRSSTHHRAFDWVDIWYLPCLSRLCIITLFATPPVTDAGSSKNKLHVQVSKWLPQIEPSCHPCFPLWLSEGCNCKWKYVCSPIPLSIAACRVPLMPWGVCLKGHEIIPDLDSAEQDWKVLFFALFIILQD